jgi:ketosteroid isomerase-like protein
VLAKADGEVELMSELENIQVIQELYAALWQGDVDSILALLAEDVDWQYVGQREDIPFAGRWRGRQGMIAFLNNLAESTQAGESDPDEVMVCGEHVLTTGRRRAKVKATGRAFETDWAHLFTVRHGRIVRFREFSDTATIAKAFRPLSPG